MLKGDILVSPQHLSIDNRVLKKFFILLSDPVKTKTYVLAITTSQKKPWREDKKGCHAFLAGDGYYVFKKGDDAKREEVLERAGIKKAKSLLACLEDAENVFIIITAKMLNPKLNIVAKVEDELNEIKLKKVGADSVVSCHDKGAQIMLELAKS